MSRRPPASVIVLFVLAVAGILVGCVPDGGQIPQPGLTESRTIDVDGVERTYRVHVPGSLAAEPALVVMLHGALGSAAQAEGAYGWNPAADRAGFLVAYPDGDHRTWNAGGCCGPPADNGVDDVAFVAAIVAELQDEFGVDPARTFATGMSNGAMMAYRLACETDLFAAIAPVAGTIVTVCDDPSPTSVVHIHGLDDDMVRMDGEIGDGAARVGGTPVLEAVAVWHQASECAEPAVRTEGEVTTASAACSGGRNVVLITVANAGHQWPGSVPRRGAADPPSTAIDATAAIWAFFDAH